MTANEYWTLAIAVYAAVISTIVFGWDVLKWAMSGPQLKIVCRPDVVLVGGGVRDTGRKLSATVVNRGDAATTLTNLHLCLYQSRLHPWLPWKKPDYFFVKAPSAVQPLPYNLEPGRQWQGIVNQNEDLEKMMRDGALFAEVQYVHSDKGLRSRRLRLHQIEGISAP
jgi:hypothetical protein